MADYIALSNINNRWGTSNVATWSDLDSNETPDTADATRVAAAIAYAEAVINDKLRNKQYALPLVTAAGAVPPVIVDIASTLAGAWLYGGRGIGEDEQGDRMGAAKDEALGELEQYASGQRVLDANRQLSEPDTPFLV